MTQKERNLISKGYQFSGVYTRDLDEAKERAKKFREEGYYAQVVTKSYEGRIYNTTGHSVFTKKRGK